MKSQTQNPKSQIKRGELEDFHYERQRRGAYGNTNFIRAGSKKIFLATSALLLLTLSFALSANAQSTMKNSSYIIRMGNFNTAAGKSSGASGSLNITVGQISPGLYTGQNFKLKAGFQYYPSGTPFSLTISNTSIDFGTLEPTNPVTRSNILTVSNQSAGGYVVSAIEDRELSAKEGVFIPDTTCDNGTCSEQTAGKWSGSLVYGFGYRCDSISTNYCPSGFTASDSFKQFANRSNSESAQTVMSGASGRNQKSQITYKVNVSTVQPAGFYTNTVTYVATPTY